MAAAAAGVGLLVHIQDLPGFAQALAYRIVVIAVAHHGENAAVCRIQNVSRTGHAALDQHAGFHAAGSSPGGVHDLVRGAAGEKRPGGARLHTGQTEGGQRPGSIEAIQLCAGGSGTEGPGGAGDVPALVAMAGDAEAHADAAHDLIAADDRFQKPFSVGTHGLGSGPCRRDDHGADVGLGACVYVVHFQGVACHGIEKGSDLHRGLFPAAPNRGGVLAGKVLRQIHLLNTAVHLIASGSDGHGDGVQHAGLCCLHHSLRCVLQMKSGCKSR